MIKSKLAAITARLAVGVTASIVALAGLVAGPAQAQEGSAWWGLTQRSQPTQIQPGRAQNEVQEVTLEATGGEVVITEEASVGEVYACLNGGGSYGECLALIKQACFAYNAEAAEAQVALEGIYGAGNVSVGGGPGDAEGSSPYEVTFVGQLEDQPVAKMSTGYPSFFGCKRLEGEASVKQASEGRPDGQLIVVAENRGNGAANGAREPITVTDSLPSGLRAVSVEAFGAGTGSRYNRRTTKSTAACSPNPAGESPLTCTYDASLPAYETIEMVIGVVVQPGASAEETNTASVSGGRASQRDRLERPVHIGGEETFGVEEAQFVPEEAGGRPDTQAGSHPFQLTSVVSFNENGEGEPIAMPKDISVLSPEGLVGNPTPFAQCTDEQFAKLVNGEETECPAASTIGVAVITFQLEGQLWTVREPIFNMVPDKGEPARFAFYAVIVPVMLDTSVRTGGDYGVTVSSKNTIENAGLLSSMITLWGVPGDPRHDAQRGYGCLFEREDCQLAKETNPPPFLSLPTSCTGPLHAEVHVSSWADRGRLVEAGMSEEPAAMVGCNHLPFAPGIDVAPDIEDAASPSGLTVGIHLPQTAALNPTGDAEATVKDTTVTLPEGVTLNPGGADGLEGCSLAEIGFLGKAEVDPNLNLFSSGLPDPFCPDGAKVGTVDIHTPLLPNDLTGAVYLASPAPDGEAGENPFDGLVSMYIVAEDPVSGVLVKLPGQVQPCERAGEVLAGVRCEAAGQLISTFKDTPQLPFEDFTLHFFGGGTAPLATPSRCGSYTASASIAPWSGNAPATPSSTFQITSGPNGSACPSNPLPFSPGFDTGMTNLQAGGYSELRTTMGHPDQDQALGMLRMTLPPGVMGSLAHVKLCPEPQASEGLCGPESLIGHTTVTAGLGSTPAVVARPGNVYITGPYKGAPYGLSIANPAETGPFDLEKGTRCDCIVVRAKIEVDPHTAQLTVTSDPLPRMIDGIPLDLQHVSVQIARPEFTFNPTSCAKMTIEGAMSGSEGAVASISEPFQVANCASLAFTPKFKAATSAKTSRKDGASLHVRLTYPNASQGAQANIRSVHVELPRALPSRLSTLNHACLDSVFNRNPAACPPESRVGFAKALTPVLPVPLEGPAYFVSHGGQKFPELIVVLQGYGVTVDLQGETFISKAGVTSSTFRTVPDVPVDSFELTLPEGAYSALAANRSLCAASLVMPTVFTGQDGEVLEQKTPVEVHGCSKTLAVRSHRVKKGTLILKVYAPSAGEIKVSGKGLKTQTKRPRARKTVTLRVPERKTKALKTRVSVIFTPSEGKTRKRQVKTLPVRFKR